MQYRSARPFRVVRVETVSIPSIFLRFIHGLVGILDQFVGVLAISGEDCDSNAGMDEQFVFADLHGMLKKIMQLPHDSRDVLRIGNRFEQDDELIAAKARYGVNLPHRRLEQDRNVYQNAVTYRMTQRVIDLLETIQIDEQHGKLPAVAP